MSWSLTFILLLCFLRVQSMDLTNPRAISPLTGFAVPEVDGSAVDDICRIFFDPTPDTPTGITTTPAATGKQQVAVTKKPAVQPPPKKPQRKQAEGPIRTQPAAARPVTNNPSNPALGLLYYLLTNRRAQTGRYSVVSRRAMESWKAGSRSSEDSSDES